MARKNFALRACSLALAMWSAGQAFLPAGISVRHTAATDVGAKLTGQKVSASESRRAHLVPRQAAKKQTGVPIKHGDTIYIKTMTGRYVGEIDGTTKLEWVKARGTKKDENHAIKIEKMGDKETPIENGDTVMLVLPNGQHMDVLGSAVRARHYDPRGQWQRITIVKQDGGQIFAGDQIFLRGHQGEYLDANPMERAPDGEVKARWRDEGEWQVMYIEK
eukprot:TRINITY_DN10514_c0_g2_i2.p1 TRINITY_DN10514_c0_g2~~TRINITY_DN10514_c0_g2_i2.p1  ORF type:complete len:219 (+),score=47.60 TRINITY_DN10514_c0_g2_i2:90-746(+)